MIANRHAAPAQVRGAECSVFANSGAFVGDYIGDSTRSEIDDARALGKPVRYTHPAVAPYGTPAATKTGAEL
ncbi:hypothetical protein [Streptomyces sp. NBC_01268]|uniref:hypothetical protein n=1 Tax=Streptomyces sp. NBC_01268 TaxID=2903806 RepID=UPI002E331BD5|nr:hypothetical protein [Streptomyces sp. NBC_01268]